MVDGSYPTESRKGIKLAVNFGRDNCFYILLVYSLKLI